LIVQQTDSSICEIVVLVTKMILQWEKIECDSAGKDLCTYLIRAFRIKFLYELESDVFHVAALVNTQSISSWLYEKEFKEIKTNAIEKLVKVALYFIVISPTEFDDDNDSLESDDDSEPEMDV
jgi:hypothetical protein